MVISGTQWEMWPMTLSTFNKGLQCVPIHRNGSLYLNGRRSGKQITYCINSLLTQHCCLPYYCPQVWIVHYFALGSDFIRPLSFSDNPNSFRPLSISLWKCIGKCQAISYFMHYSNICLMVDAIFQVTWQQVTWPWKQAFQCKFILSKMSLLKTYAYRLKTRGLGCFSYHERSPGD